MAKRVYAYRLTVTFKSTRQWKLGVQTVKIGTDVAGELDGDDVAHIYLSRESTGKGKFIRGRSDVSTHTKNA